MKMLIQSAMIFFGTLMAAAVVALGEPGQADVAMVTDVSSGIPAQAHADSASGSGSAKVYQPTEFTFNKAAAASLR